MLLSVRNEVTFCRLERLRAGQEQRLTELLPALRLNVPPAGEYLDPRGLFPVPTDEVWLEIGFGGGEHLAAQAAANPRTGIIGAEPFVNGVVKLLRAVDEGALRNVRVWDEDATALLAALPDSSLARVYLLYPDPWPKRRQRKRRFLSEPNLARLARALKPGAPLRFATDIDDYAGWVLARVLRGDDFAWDARGADDWRVPWDGWPSTRYEQKATRGGRPPAYLTFRRL